jgi:hypothetical protein
MITKWLLHHHFYLSGREKEKKEKGKSPNLCFLNKNNSFPVSLASRLVLTPHWPYLCHLTTQPQRRVKNTDFT